MTCRDEFLKHNPKTFFLDVDAVGELGSYLRERGWLAAGEEILAAVKAGEGNMNCVVRVTTAERSLILKQARPWVEKYPHIAAPWERTLIEGSFYRVVSTENHIAAMMPKLLGLDAVSHIVALEDLGVARDFTTLYSGEALSEPELDELTAYLSRLHSAFVGAAFKSDLANSSMKALNHLHIFVVPLQADNGINLDAFTGGLEVAAQSLKRDERYVRAVRGLGELYLGDGASLLHGDYFPGSWLKTAGGVRIIDPEFCFYGPPEFDVGVMIAHLLLSEQDRELAPRLLARYGRPRSSELVWQFAGVEIMRRLIGVAQLPLSNDLERKVKLLMLSRELVLNPGRGVEA